MRGKVWRAISVIVASALIVVVIWIDATTTLWQELVILSGLAASLVTFVFTTVFIGWYTKRATAKRWAPMTRLALTEIIHQLADDDRSEVDRGAVVPRQIVLPDRFEPAASAELRKAVVAERHHLANTLSRWWEFLSATADSDELLRHIATASFTFDRVRDDSLELDAALSSGDAAREHASLERLTESVRRCNEAIAGILEELRASLEEEVRVIAHV